MNHTEELVLRTQVAELKNLVHELKYELDRLKHEAALLRISSDSFDRRWDLQIKMNEQLLEEIKNS